MEFCGPPKSKRKIILNKIQKQYLLPQRTLRSAQLKSQRTIIRQSSIMYYLAKVAPRMLSSPIKTLATASSYSQNSLEKAAMHTRTTYGNHINSRALSRPLALSQPRSKHRLSPSSLSVPRAQRVGLATSQDNSPPPPNKEQPADEANKSKSHQRTSPKKTEIHVQPPPPSPKAKPDPDPQTPNSVEPTFYWDNEPMYPPRPLVWLYRFFRSPFFWGSMVWNYLTNCGKDGSISDVCTIILVRVDKYRLENGRDVDPFAEVGMR